MHEMCAHTEQTRHTQLKCSHRSSSTLKSTLCQCQMPRLSVPPHLWSRSDAKKTRQIEIKTAVTAAAKKSNKRAAPVCFG